MERLARMRDEAHSEQASIAVHQGEDEEDPELAERRRQSRGWGRRLTEPTTQESYHLNVLSPRQTPKTIHWSGSALREPLLSDSVEGAGL